MLIANKYEVPNTCPVNCPYKDDFKNYGQSARCGRCPIFNCKEFKYEDGSTDRLLNPENFREDWAKEWYNFFEGDMSESPQLYL